MLTLEEYSAGQPLSGDILAALQRAIAEVGPAALRVSKSQVTFRRRRAFAWAWMPGMYLRSGYAPLVLTVALRRRDPSPRWKAVVEPAPGRFTHHLELRSADELDAEVRAWLREAWEQAG